MLDKHHSEPLFQADVVCIGSGVVVAFHGELDVANAPAMRDCLADVILQHGDGLKLEINFSEVQYIDSVCLSVLIFANKRLKESGGSMAVLNPSLPVRKVMEITGLLPLFSAENAESTSVQL